MHAFGLYLAAIEAEHDDGASGARTRRPRWAAVDALPLDEPGAVSRRDRLAAILRRRPRAPRAPDSSYGAVRPHHRDSEVARTAWPVSPRQ